jgi:hypothetical protein
MSNLPNKAILVNLHAPGFTNTKQDSQASGFVTNHYAADSDAATVIKKLLPKDVFSGYTNAVMATRLVLYKYSHPWLDGGWRILPTALYPDFCREIQELRVTRIDPERQKFLNSYDAAVANSRRLGGLYQQSDYPSRAKLERKLVFEINEMPLSDVNDFRCTLTTDDEIAIKARIEAQLAQAQANIQAENRNRLATALGELVSKLARYDGTRSGAFRDSVLDDIREQVNLLPKMDLVGDQELIDMIANVEKTICGNSPEGLRENETLRQSVIADSDKMLTTMRGWDLGEDDDE